MNHRTQMQAARQGDLTPEMAAAARAEGLAEEFVREGVAAGRIVIPANRLHTTLVPAGIGSGLRTKINVNLGISRDSSDLPGEIEKVSSAVALGADAIMDLSCEGDTRAFRRRLVESVPVMIGTVPAYDVLGCQERELADLSTEDWLRAAEDHARDGVDFMTFHAGLNRESARRLRHAGRLMKRGGRLPCAIARGFSLTRRHLNRRPSANTNERRVDGLFRERPRRAVRAVSRADSRRPQGFGRIRNPG